MAHIRPAAVAGTFYPRGADELAAEVSSLLADAEAPPGPIPKAIIAPHAGYIYSGPIAASIYARLKPARSRIRRVVILGPAHFVSVRGLVLPDADGLATPLGVVSVDTAAAQSLLTLPQVREGRPAHAREHSLEVQLPFLQTVLEDFSVVPLAVGEAEAEQVAEVLQLAWGDQETLLVVSSDLSHYLGYREAQQIDRRTATAVVELRGPIAHEQACGATPINGLLLAAQRHGLSAQLVDLRNSGDTSGDPMRVVGYGAFAFYKEPVRVH